MTYLDRFKREHPLVRKKHIIVDLCPEDRLIVCATEDDPEGRTCMCPSDDRGNTLTCEECWLRQVPDDDITVAGPVYEPDAGLSETGPDRT